MEAPPSLRSASAAWLLTDIVWWIERSPSIDARRIVGVDVQEALDDDYWHAPISTGPIVLDLPVHYNAQYFVRMKVPGPCTAGHLLTAIHRFYKQPRSPEAFARLPPTPCGKREHAIKDALLHGPTCGPGYERVMGDVLNFEGITCEDRFGVRTVCLGVNVEARSLPLTAGHRMQG